MKLDLEDKEELSEFVKTEYYHLIKKVLSAKYDAEVKRLLTIPAENKEKLQIEKAKIEGISALISYYDNIKK